LFRFISLFADLTLEFLLGLVDSTDALLSVLLKLLDLVFKPLLVLFVLLHMLALNDLLSLLSYSVELDILGTLFEVLYFKIKALLLVLDLLQVHLEVADLVHKLDLELTLSVDFLVLVVNQITRNEDGILVVSGNRKLRNFDLALLKVADHLEVVADLVNSIQSLVLCNGLTLVLFVEIVKLVLKMLNVVIELLDLVFKLFFVLEHLNSAVTLLHKTFEVFLAKPCNIILLKVEDFSFFVILHDLLYASSVNSAEWIEFYDAS
jgi:hypothetical protein